MANEIEFFEDPLEFTDSMGTSRKTAQEDTVPMPNDQVTAQTKMKRAQTDEVTPPQDEVTIAQTQKPHIQDQVEMPSEDLNVLSHHHETGVVPRIDATKIQTEADALAYMSNELIRRFRFNMYDNMIDAPINKLELEDALLDSLEEINQFIQPHSSWDLVYFVKLGRRYRRLLLLGAAKNLMLMMVSHGTSNGVEVAIEDFSVSDKTSDFMSLYSELKDTFQEQLTQMKEYDRLVVKYSTFSTGKRRYGGGGYNSVGVRVSRIVRSGGFVR